MLHPVGDAEATGQVPRRVLLRDDHRTLLAVKLVDLLAVVALVRDQVLRPLLAQARGREEVVTARCGTCSGEKMNSRKCHGKLEPMVCCDTEALFP